MTFTFRRQDDGRWAVMAPGALAPAIVADNIISQELAQAIAHLPELLELYQQPQLGPYGRPLGEILEELGELTMSFMPPFGVDVLPDGRTTVVVPGPRINPVIADNIISLDTAQGIAVLPELLELHRAVTGRPGARPVLEIIEELRGRLP